MIRFLAACITARYQPVRLTQRGRDVMWACRFMAVLLLGLLLASAVDGWLR